MDQKILVDAITTETADWTCKVQVVDKFRPRKSSDSSVHFQTIIVQDEKSSLLRDYKNNRFLQYSTAMTLLRYSIRAGTYEWVVDRYTIVEAINTNDGLEAPLPAPTKLNALSFSAIEYQRPGVKFAD
ncbi:hypothetical protein P3L10_017774 [Capsicum annuum]